MDRHQDTLDDIDCMARYWMKRREELRFPAAEEFSAYVRPLYLAEGANPTQAQVDCVNAAFTEWLLFERRHEQGMTPLEIFVDRMPVALPAASWRRLGQVAQTQFFSRFSIAEKDRSSGLCRLVDVCTGAGYEVFDDQTAGNSRWGEGTLGVRIACVDGAWLAVAPSRLYDRAPCACTMVDGPGAIHPEEADRLPPAMRESFFLRLLHDTFGLDGRYHESLNVREEQTA